MIRPIRPIEVIEAIKKNGYPKRKNTYGGIEAGEFMGCSLGQAAHNLEVSAYSVETILTIQVRPEPERLNHLKATHWFASFNYDTGTVYLNDYIKFLNDETDLSVTEIGEIAEKLYLESIA